MKLTEQKSTKMKESKVQGLVCKYPIADSDHKTLVKDHRGSIGCN